jgi:hypothetical protein
MAKVKMFRGLQANYDAIPIKDGDAVYICTDTGNSYLGDKKLDADWNYIEKPTIELHGGIRVYLDGVDVTNNASVQTLNASRQWFGSMSQYARLVHDNQVQSGVAYHLYPNPDWDESDEESLAYIKNKPTILDVSIGDTSQSNNKNMILFYK